MRLDAAIKATQIGQNVVQKAVVMLVKRTLPGIINIRLDSAPPVSGLLVVGQIKGTKKFIFRREPATSQEHYVIRDIIAISEIIKISEIMEIILQFHENLFGVDAGQAKLQLDIGRGKNVSRG